MNVLKSLQWDECDVPVRSYPKALLSRVLGGEAEHFRYSPVERVMRMVRRSVNPVPRSPWTSGKVDDIGAVHLVPPATLESFFYDCIDTLRHIRGDEIGDYLEFGVFNGSSMGSMVRSAKRQGIEKTRFFGFDAFQGLPEGSENEDDGVWKKGFYACPFEDMKASLRKRGVDPDAINWVNGWYDATLNAETAARYELSNPGIVFVDCDTYSSSKLVLDFVGPMIHYPVIMCFDDWKLNDLDVKGMGEYRSFNEFLEKNPHLKAREIPSYNRKSKSFLVRSV